MRISDMVRSGLWPTVDPLAGVTVGGLVAAWDASNGNFNNLLASPADGAAQSAYNLTASGLTFNGVAGRKSAGEYAVTAGSGYAALAANTTFTAALHNAGARFTLACVFSKSGTGGTLFSTGNGSGGSYTGIHFYVDNQGPDLQFFCNNGAVAALNYRAGFVATAGFYHFAAVTVDDVAGQKAMYHNGVYSGSAGAYVGPAGGVPQGALRLGADIGATYLPAGSRIGQALIWNRALVKDELDQTFASVRRRWGI